MVESARSWKDLTVSASASPGGHSSRQRDKVDRDLDDAAIRRRVGADQLAYYEARAPWYDDVYACRGDYDGGEERNARWRADLAEIEGVLARAGMAGDCVELGAGTGYWSERVIDRVDRLWALDAVPDVLHRARARLGDRAGKVRFDVVDLWTWAPDRMWDSALACFFFEHVPDELFPGLLERLHGALRPGGALFMAEAAASGPEPQVETREVGGRVFDVVERRRSPAELAEAFTNAGFAVDIETISQYVCLTGRRQ